MLRFTYWVNSRHVRWQIFLQRTQASFLRTFPLVLFSSVAWTGIEILWHCPLPPALPFQPQTSDLQLVRDALRSLRNSFSGHDPQHHTIDSLEQGISSLMERLMSLPLYDAIQDPAEGCSCASVSVELMAGGGVTEQGRDAW